MTIAKLVETLERVLDALTPLFEIVHQHVQIEGVEESAPKGP
ncbi:hypothetical protein ABL850_32165 [Variovorax paradoxus]|nr:hypothetical protein [Variovorax paradoxus]